MIDYKRLEKLLETCGGFGEWRYTYREGTPTVHTIEDDIVTIAQDNFGIVGRDPDWELMAMAPGLAEEVLCMRDEAQAGYTSLVQGSLSLTSAEAIAVHAKAVSVLRKILAADRASEYPHSLQDAGLLAPENKEKQ